jgi:hypothetical protein
MKIRIFQKFLVLFFCLTLIARAQQKDNVVTIELSATTFSIERPFTISVLVQNSENRPLVAFPDIPGLAKRGTSISLANTETGGEMALAQLITQTYVATQPGTFRLAPFSITVNGVTARSEGAVLMVRPATTGPFGGTGLTVSLNVPTESGAAFLSLRASKTDVFVGEGFALRLSLFVSDAYPFELRFNGVDAQLQTVLKQLRPSNTWVEEVGIQELKGQPVRVNDRTFREYVISQGVYFPLSAGSIQLPSVSLNLVRVRSTEPSAATAAAAATEVAEPVAFQARPLTVAVKPLPSHPLRGQVPVGVYRLVETIDRTTVPVGKSTRYTIRLEGEGNIASLQTPLWSTMNSTTTLVAPSPATEAGLETLPAQASQQIDRTGEQVIGSKTFGYFLVPRRGGTMDLSTVFGFIYFNLQTARYDTLRSKIRLQVNDTDLPGTPTTVAAEPEAANRADDLFVGLNKLDSTEEPLNLAVLTRAVANVLLVMMILGMIFVFLRK